MKKRDASSFALPMMMTRLAMASAETIMHRMAMMAQGTCSAAEYQRMALEKTSATQRSMLALWSGHSHAAIVAPFLVRAQANAKRLRRNG